ncbi:MAG: ABC transporter ATP-binding protein [Actinomycetota bacterium]|nr:ABC transporter ATP-binding protein [Actinomycetota bacterium]
MTGALGETSTQRAARASDTGEGPGGGSFLLEATRGHRRTLAASVGAALVWTAAISTYPLFIGRAVDAGLLDHRWRRLALYVGLIAVLGAIQALASGARRRNNGLASRRVEAELRKRFFTRLLGLDVAYHDRVNRGQLLSRVTSDLFQVQAFVASAPALVGNAFAVVAVAVILLVVSPVLGAIAVVMLPIIVLTSKRYAAAVRPALGNLQRERGQLAGVVEETISGIRAVKGFGAESLLTERLGERADAVRGEALDVVRTRATFSPYLNVVPMLELVAINWVGGYLVLHHEMTVGLLLSFNTYLVLLTGPLQSIGWFVVQFQRALVSSRRIGTIMALEAGVTDPPPGQTAHLPSGRGAIGFHGVDFTYPGAERPVLEGLDLEIDGGEVVALVGPTGSGKSTVAALIARLYDPREGVVTLDGVALRDLPLDEVRAAVGVVFEDNFLFDATIADNLRVGRESASEEELRDAIRVAGAEEIVGSLPAGIDTPIGEQGYSLSGGQRQRIALARAILAAPRVLVLDDATSAVDAAKEREILDGLRSLMGGRTIVIISHRAATVALADRVVLLEGGRVAADGTHQGLLRSSRAYRQVLGLATPGGARSSPTATAGSCRPGGAEHEERSA